MGFWAKTKNKNASFILNWFNVKAPESRLARSYVTRNL